MNIISFWHQLFRINCFENINEFIPYQFTLDNKIGGIVIVPTFGYNKECLCYAGRYSTKKFKNNINPIQIGKPTLALLNNKAVRILQKLKKI